jgi:predicted transcriptional regulator
MKGADMDKVLSARIDESVLRRIELLARELGTTKKAVIENAIRLYADRLETERQIDVLDRTWGAWQREETPEETVERSRFAFRRSMRRRHL